MRKRSLDVLCWLSLTAASLGPAAAQVGTIEIRPMTPRLSFFSRDAEGHGLGVGDNTLYRIADGGARVTAVHTFPSHINGVHVTLGGVIIVATDDDWWNPTSLCRLYRSRDGGATFEVVKAFRGGSALWWSLASDSAGSLYVGEYGPRGVGQSKRVWKSTDDGDTWSVAFRALDVDGVHLHRIAVDPYTDDVWVTQGDAGYQATFVSRDHGATWNWVRDSQATSVVFTPEAIYWGEDSYRGQVTRFSRTSQVFETVLDASTEGNFGGSVYDMAVGRTGLVYVPMVKYSNQSHVPALWVGAGEQWQLLLSTPVAEDRFGGFRHISPPDNDGYLYVEGYRIADPSPPPVDVTTAVAAETGVPATTPAADLLAPNFPNPFNDGTTIAYHLGRPERVRLAIYNIRGQVVRHLVDGEQSAGNHLVVWNGTDEFGAPLGSGTYLCSLRTDRTSQIRRLVLLK